MHHRPVMRRSAPALVPLVVATAALAFAGCTDAEIGTTPYAHETPPGPPSPVEAFAMARFLGGAGVDVIEAVTTDDLGFYVVGMTSSADFPVTRGPAFDPTLTVGCGACPAAGFVTALDANGTIRWSTLVESPGYDHLTSVVRLENTLYVAGASGPRPGLGGWHGGGDTERGAQDGIVCALARDTGELHACRYVGGNGGAGVSDLTVTSSTSLAVTFTTTDTEALHLDPAYAAAFARGARGTSAGGDGVVLGLSTTLDAPDNLRWATYVGGTGTEDGRPALWSQGSGRIFYLGTTSSADVPVPGGWLTTAPAGRNAFLTELTLDGSAVTYGTYLGGDGDEDVGPGGVAGLSDDELHVAITTTSSTLATSPGAPQPSYGGDGGTGCGRGDVWVATFAMPPTTVTWTRATYLGGAVADRAGRIPVQPGWSGAAVLVAGATSSTNFPIFFGAQPMFAGRPCTNAPDTSDGFATAIGARSPWIGSTFIGGTSVDRATAIASPSSGAVVVVGRTRSADFPIVGTTDATLGGAEDGFIAVLQPRAWSPWPVDGAVSGDGGANIDGEGATGCCGASTPTPGSLGLVGLVAIVLGARRRRRR